MVDAVRSVDYIARLAEAWDGRGRNPFTAPTEHLGLLAMANLPVSLVHTRWEQLESHQRSALVFAARRAVDLGRACAWVFGEGRGA